MAEKDLEANRSDSIKSQIVAAAKKRFTHFGYGKTTMAEVAADCGMSPGNLYRFFPGKLDIADGPEIFWNGRHQGHRQCRDHA